MGVPDHRCFLESGEARLWKDTSDCMRFDLINTHFD